MPSLWNMEQVQERLIMSTAITNKLPLDGGEEPSTQEIELVKWGEETIRGAETVLHDSLKQLITLNTALLAGSVAFLDRLPGSKGWKIAGAICLLLSLLLALWGNYPRELRLCPHVPSEIKMARDRITVDRASYLLRATTVLVAGLVSFMAGLIL
jgi:hypothetical protein